MSRERSLLKNTIILSFGTLLPKFATIITLPIITAKLTKIEYGTYDLINILATLFLPIITLQMQSAAFRFLIENRKDKKQQKTIVTNIIVFLICTSLVSLIILFFCLKKIDIITRGLVCVYFFVDTLISATRQIVRGLSRNKEYSISSIINSFVNLILVVIFLSIFDMGLYGLLLSIIISLIISLIYLMSYCDIFKFIEWNLISKNELTKMLKYSWPLVPNSLSNWIMSVSDRLVITNFLGLEANAIYAIANKLPSIFTMLQGTFTLAWQENASLSISDKDVDEYYSSMFDNVFSILSGILAIFIGISPVLFYILIKGNYSEAYNQIPILYIAMLFSSIASFLGGIYIANMKSKEVGITTAIAAMSNLLINLLLINIIGIYAASISTLISYLILMIYRMYDIKKIQNICYKIKKILFIVILLSIMSFICSLQITVFNIINLFLGIIIAFVLNRKIIHIVIKKFTNIIKNKRIKK